MKSWQFFVFFCIALMVFAVYVLSRETVSGADTPTFLLYSCQKQSIGKGGTPIGMLASQLFFKILPCNTLFFKGLAVLLLLASVLVIAKTGELFDAQFGWLAGLFAFSNGIFLVQLLELEEQNLAYPIIFLGFYFVLKKDFWKAASLFIIAGLFWRGSIYYFLMLSLYWTWLAIFTIPFVIVFWEKLTSNLFNYLATYWQSLQTGAQMVQENTAGVGVIGNWLLLAGALTKNKRILAGAIYCLVLAFLSYKYTLYAVPFLAVGLVEVLKDYPNQFRFAVIVFCVGMLVFQITMIPNLFPNQKQLTAIKEGIKLANGEKVCNHFGIGWTIKFYGGKTDYYSGFPDCNATNWKGVIIDTNSAFVQ